MGILDWFRRRDPCSIGRHAETRECRWRFMVVNSQRRTIAGQFETRTICSKCGVELSSARRMPIEDFSDASFDDDQLSQLLKTGELLVDVVDSS